MAYCTINVNALISIRQMSTRASTMSIFLIAMTKKAVDRKGNRLNHILEINPL